MSMVQINFNFVAPFEVIMWRIDLTSKQESHVGTYQFGVITQFALPGTEWRFTEMGHPRPFQTYVTTDAPMQHVEVGKIVSSHPGAVPVTDSPVTLGVPITGPLRTPVTPAVTVTVTPGVVVTGTLSNPSISVGSTTPPAGGSPLVGAKDSIFNSESFDKNVIDLEYAIRQQSGLTDKNQRRAAVYAAMMAIARAQNRTSKEQAVMDWLAGQVKKTRIDAARLALEEYDRWTSDPWSYHPPQGYDFPPYQIAPRNSPQWLLSTPNPPMLAYPTLESYFRDLAIKTVAGGASAWSPLSSTFMKLKQKSTREGAVGFPTYGAVLAYQKLTTQMKE